MEKTVKCFRNLGVDKAANSIMGAEMTHRVDEGG